MEIRGEDFLKNLEIEKEKAKLQKQTDKLNKSKETSVYLDSNENIQIDNSKNDTQLDDIILKSNKNNKQKYITLGFALLILFLITIIIIRLISEPKNSNEFQENSLITNELSEKDLKLQDTVVQSQDTQELDINKIEQSEENIQYSQENNKKLIQKSDVFNINSKTKKKEKEKYIIKQNELKEIIPNKLKTKEKITIIKERKTIIKKNINGFYIQVGAFTKQPNQSLIKTLNKNNLKHILHKMTINKKLYTKVLIGPYPSRLRATVSLEDIRKQTSKPKAYILEIK